ncbi:hypothetical protein ACFPIK_00910 [Algoriphagus aquatilis]|uniref:Glucosamine inositolphosphorylceramide transferase 1 N-terminal domain-containing protein n=1 Tax=Algoriphagus aquatilis TaxID=490186 RepID=A0ABW0BSW7_9BACT
MLRIGILLDSSTIQAWQAEAIRQILSSGLAEISVLVFNQSPKSSGNPSPMGYRIYRALDRTLFNTKWDAFKAVSIDDILPRDIETVTLKPIQKKYRDSFSNADLDRIEEFKLDVLLRFGFRILSGKILTLPKLGVWSFHHGDPAVYRGGPPAFWEVMRQIPSTGVALLQLTEKLDQGPILYQSWTQTDPLSVQRNANKLFWLSACFPVRVIREIHQVGLEKWKNNRLDHPNKPTGPLWRPPSASRLLPLISKLIFRTILRKWKERLFKPHWDLGYVENLTFTNQILAPQDVQLVPNPRSAESYLADPFPIQQQGKDWIFAEEYSKREGKGRITVVDQQGAIRPVVEEKWHLSYPFIWEENGQWSLIPESAASGQIWKYTAVDFPFVWQRKEVMLPVEGYDPTLWKSTEGYWLFVNQKAHPACSPFDELYLYFSPSLDFPTWVSHALNPIVSDVRRSRPAGRLFLKNGKLYRPAQDSEKRYGHRIRLMEIKKLSLSDYEEVEVCKIEPSESSSILGIHTLNQMGDRWVMDFYFRK